LREQPGTTIIDIREAGEMPVVDEFDCLHIPIKQLPHQQELISGETVIVFCQTGKRSLQAAKLLSAIFKERKKIYSLKGGILSWKQSVANQPA
jgi:adenylyltransferase/sulfurtransferase